MKRVLEVFVSSIAIGVGMEVAHWLWEDTLKEKAQDLKKRLKEVK